MRQILFKIVSLLVLAPACLAFNYPIGIPQAWIAPDVARPARPNPWTTEVPGYYFVDESASNSTDIGRSYGTPSAPRKSLPANPIPAGSYVEVAGVYTKNAAGLTVVKAAGNTRPWVANTDGPVWLVGPGANRRASFSSQLMLEGIGLCAEHLDNLAGNQKFTIASGNIAAGRTAAYMLIRDCELDGAGTLTSAFVINGSDPTAGGAMTHDIIAFRNTVHGFGPLVPDTDRDHVGIFVHNYTEKIWVLDNHVYQMAGGGISISTRTSLPSYSNYVYIGRNHIHNTWAGGIGLKTSNHVVISENRIHDTVYTSWSQAKGIGVQYAALDTWILHNTIYNCDYGIRLGSTDNSNESIHVIGNLLHSIRPNPNGSYGSGGYAPAAISLWGGTNRFVIGNTVYNSVRGLAMPSAKSLPHGAVIEYNLFCTWDLHPIQIDQNITTPKINYNVFHQQSGSATIRLGSGSVAISNIGNGNLERAPLFADAANGDFNVQAQLPPLEVASLTRNIFDDFSATYGIPLPARTYSELISLLPIAPTRLQVTQPQQ